MISFVLRRLAGGILAALALGALGSAASAQAAPDAAKAPPAGFSEKPLPGPAPNFRDIAYARSDASTGQGHLLDLYLPARKNAKVPLVIFTHGSGWGRDNGRFDAQAVAEQLLPRGYAVAGVAIRSSGQGQFPDQLHDIKAAIRWLRAHADKYGIDAAHIGIMGESSGGWTAAMAATTGDVRSFEGDEGNPGYSSAVQAAVAFYPPTDFLQMDPWALKTCDPNRPAWKQGQLCHRSADSPESLFIGCTIEMCRDRVEAANPIRYISPKDPPIMVIHGERDELVPHAQGEALYQALNKACHDAVFVSMPVASHGIWNRMLTDPSVGYGATIRSTASEGCAVKSAEPATLSWRVLIDFFDKALKTQI